MRSFLVLLFFFFMVRFVSQETFSLQMQSGHTLPVSSIAVHPELPIIASGSQDHSIIFWNTDTQKQLGSLNLATSKILTLDYSKDGDRLLTLTAKGHLILYQTVESKIVAQHQFGSELGYMLSASFTTNPKIIVIGSSRDELFLWNIETDQVTKHTKGFDTYTSSKTLDYNGRYYINFKGAKSFQLIDRETTDTTVLALEKPNNYEFNPARDLLAVGSTKLFAGIYKTTTGELIQQIEPNPEKKCDGCNLKVFWRPDGKQLATFDHKNGLYIWEGSFEKPSFKIELTERIEHYSYSQTGRYILLSNDKSLWIIDGKTEKIVLQYDSKFLAGFIPKLSNDEDFFFVPGDLFSLQKVSISTGKAVAVYKGANNQEDNQLPYNYLDWYQSGSLKHFKQLSPMQVSRHKSFIIFGKVGQDVQILNLKNGNISTLFKSSKSITSLAISENDSLIAAGDAAGNLTIYNLTDKTISLQVGVHTDMIFDLSFDSKTKQITSCGWDGRTYQTDLSSGEKTFISEESYASNKIVADGKGLYYFKANLDNSIVMHEVDSHQEVRRFIGHTKKINDLFFDENAGRLFSCSQDGSVRIWDVASGLLIAKYYLRTQSSALSLTKHPSQDLLLVGGIDRRLYSIDLKKGQMSISEPIHSSGIGNVQFIDDNTIVLRGLDGVIKFIDITKMTELYTLYLYPNTEWLAVEPKSMSFDGTQQAMKQIHVVKGSQTKKIGNLFNKYYTPRLILQLLNGETKNADEGRNIEQILDNNIDFELAVKNKLNEYSVPVKDSAYDIHSSTASIQVRFSERYKYKDIFIYNNNKLVLTQSSDEEIAFRGNKELITVEVPLVPQKNEIKFKVIDKENIEHSHPPILLNYDTIAAKTDLFILSLGINQYQNKNYNLKYAKNDASQFVSFLQDAAKPLYEQVHVYSLSDKKVTKENVLNLIDEISAKIGPEDVFVFYYAGHGVMYDNNGADNDFFLVMSDITNLYGGKEMLLEKGVSSEELLMISKRIVAQKQVFFLDACQSGAALNVLATRGVAREKALAQLARSSGTFFITASQDIEYANESSSLEHGLFTYAILEILTGQATGYADEIVSMGELKNYVEMRVPELSEQFKTTPQYPTGYSFGNDFPIGVLNPK